MTTIIVNILNKAERLKLFNEPVTVAELNQYAEDVSSLITELGQWRNIKTYKKHPMQEITPEVIQGQLDWYDAELRKYEAKEQK